MNNITFSGEVIHGKALGRTLGFPTANIHLEPGILEDGVYALSSVFHNITIRGIGTYRENINLFEAHFFDFQEDLYGKIVSIQIGKKIRENRKMSSLDDLKNQIHQDILLVKNTRDDLRMT